MTERDAPGPWAQVAAALGSAGGLAGGEEADGASAGGPAVPAAWSALGAALGTAGGGAGPAAGAAGSGAAPGGATAVAERPDGVPAAWSAFGAALAGTGSADADAPRPAAGAGPAAAGGPFVTGAAAVTLGLSATGGRTAAGPRRRALPSARGLLATRRRRVAAGAAAAVVAAAVVVPLALGGGGGLPSSDAFAVNGHAVSVSDFDAELQIRQTLYGITPPAPSAGAKYHAYLTSAAQAEAVSILLDQLAPAQGVTVSTQTAETSLAKAIQSQYGGSQTAFANALGAAGLNEPQVLAEVQHNLVYQQLFTKVVGTPSVTQAQVQAYFAGHRSQLALPETRDISHIVVSAQAGAQSIIAQLQGGASFATLAAASSLDTATAKSGGVLGRFAKDDLQPAFAAAAFAAPVGQPFGPVQDGSDWEVGVVTAVHPAAPATLDATTSSAIKTLLVDQAQADRWDAWLGARLAAAHISYNPAYRPAHPDAPPVIPVPKLTGETLAGVGTATGAGARPGPSGAAGGSGAPSGSASGGSSANPGGPSANPGG